MDEEIRKSMRPTMAIIDLYHTTGVGLDCIVFNLLFKACWVRGGTYEIDFDCIALICVNAGVIFHRRAGAIIHQS